MPIFVLYLYTIWLFFSPAKDNMPINYCLVSFCRDTICSSSPKCMKSWPSEPSTINL